MSEIRIGGDCKHGYPLGDGCDECKAARELAASTGSEPLRIAFSQQEMVDAAKTWIRKSYPATEHDPDLRMERLGLLIDFVTDLVPNVPNAEL